MKRDDAYLLAAERGCDEKTIELRGDRCDDGYRVGPGKWVVGGTDGFSRSERTNWTVKNVRVGDELWTIAN